MQLEAVVILGDDRDTVFRPVCDDDVDDIVLSEDVVPLGQVLEQLPIATGIKLRQPGDDRVLVCAPRARLLVRWRRLRPLVFLAHTVASGAATGRAANFSHLVPSHRPVFPVQLLERRRVQRLRGSRIILLLPRTAQGVLLLQSRRTNAAVLIGLLLRRRIGLLVPFVVLVVGGTG